MDVKAVDQKRKRVKKSGEHKHKGRKGDLNKRKHRSKGTHKKGHGSKSGSKSKKKKSGFLCCRKKQKKQSVKKSRTRSKVTKKQPKSKGVKSLAPVPNEQLGEVVLVKNVKSQPGTPVVPQEQKAAKGSQEQLTPEKEALKAPKITTSGEDVKLSKEKIESGKDEKEKIKTDSQKVGENEKEEGPVKSDEKDETGKKSPKENGIDVQKIADEVDKDHSFESKFINLKSAAEKAVAPGSKVAIVSDIAEDLRLSRYLTTKVAFTVISKNMFEFIHQNEFSQVSCYIPPHITKKHFVANMSKNRFADVICLDHSRVKLTDSSYIHANWVDLSSQKKAILTQFPLSNTASEFWQMVIDHKVKCVLLIMTDQEYKRFGGDFVFPQNQDFLSFDDRSIRVGEFKQTELSKGWNMRVISVTNGTYKAFIHVHHYKNWLHNTAPADSKQIWQLQSYLQKYSDPPVYMSLSGCGRAGTWALFESANASLTNEQPGFNMIRSLENIRHGRLHSVQTLPQFSFVYTMIANKVLGNAPTAEIGKDQESSTAAILRQLTIQ